MIAKEFLNQFSINSCSIADLKEVEKIMEDYHEAKLLERFEHQIIFADEETKVRSKINFLNQRKLILEEEKRLELRRKLINEQKSKKSE